VSVQRAFGVTLPSYRVEPGSTVRLKKIDPDDSGPFAGKEDAAAPTAADLDRLHDLQERFFIDGRYALLLVLQGMDTAGKDGMVRHLSGGLNLAGTEVTSFKAPTPEELAHDFLWRIHARVPARSHIGIFNRSHYEDVLAARVRGLVPEHVWRDRYDEINAFEEILTKNNVIILKCFLHISKDEQKERLLARLDEPDKRWKFQLEDLAMRSQWDEFQAAYEDALTKCSTKRVPWYIIPANRKWYRNFAITRLLVDTLAGLDLTLPKPAVDPRTISFE
jgi:PPK2 family polyphosphate:nucleotide phosphotransferase